MNRHALAGLVLASLLFNDFRVRATIVAVVFAVGWLMYFRMFGKLAGYCAERTKLENAEDDEDEEEFESLKIAEDREPPAVHLS